MGPWSQRPSSQQPSPTRIGRRSNWPALFGAVEGKRMSVGMQGRSLDPKRGVATAIAEAQANLERAVEELDRRSEERRVGKECRSRGGREHCKKTTPTRGDRHVIETESR